MRLFLNLSESLILRGGWANSAPPHGGYIAHIYFLYQIKFLFPQDFCAMNFKWDTFLGRYKDQIGKET